MEDSDHFKPEGNLRVVLKDVPLSLMVGDRQLMLNQS
jgi:hypothetical protein